jgi:hypothetical protein
MTLIGCDQTNHYKLDCCNLDPDSKDQNNIYYITSNLSDGSSLQAKNDTLLLKRYLKPDEFKNIFDRSILITKYDTFNSYKQEFVPIDTLLTTDKYVAELVLIMNKNQNHYCFQVRTYDKLEKIISFQNFAMYSDSLKEYYSGDFNRRLRTFKLEWYDKVENYKLDTHGNIIKTK